MPLGEFSIEMRPEFRRVARFCFRTAVDLTRLRDPLQHAAYNIVTPSIMANFEAGGRPPWRPHSEETVKRRTQRGTYGVPQPILMETGRLFAAASKRTRWTITQHEARYGDLPQGSWYGRLHQEGDGGMPERPWAMFHDDDVIQIERHFADFIDDAVDRNWRKHVGVGI